MDRTLYFREYTPVWRHHKLFVYDSSSTNALDTGGFLLFHFYNVGSRSAFSASLVWMDPVGASLVNDLDLLVTLSSGQSYWGNFWFNSSQGNNRDSTNNVERVLLPYQYIPSIVNITVNVSAFVVRASQPQAFALVVNCDENGELGAGIVLRVGVGQIILGCLAWVLVMLMMG